MEKNMKSSQHNTENYNGTEDNTVCDKESFRIKSSWSMLEGRYAASVVNEPEMRSHQELKNCSDSAIECAKRNEKIMRVRKAIEVLRANARKNFDRPVAPGGPKVTGKNGISYQRDEELEIGGRKSDSSDIIVSNRLDSTVGQEIPELFSNGRVSHESGGIAQTIAQSEFGDNTECAYEMRLDSCLCGRNSSTEKRDLAEGTVGVPSLCDRKQELTAEKENRRNAINAKGLTNCAQEQVTEGSRSRKERRNASLGKSSYASKETDHRRGTQNFTTNRREQRSAVGKNGSASFLKDDSNLLQIERTCAGDQPYIDDVTKFVRKRTVRVNERDNEEDCNVKRKKDNTRVESLVSPKELERYVTLNVGVGEDGTRTSGEDLAKDSSVPKLQVKSRIARKEDVGINCRKGSGHPDGLSMPLEGDESRSQIHIIQNENMDGKRVTFNDICNGHVGETTISAKESGAEDSDTEDSSVEVSDSEELNAAFAVENVMDSESTRSITDINDPDYFIVNSFRVFSLNDTAQADDITSALNDADTSVDFLAAATSPNFSSTPKKALPMPHEANECSELDSSQEHTIGSAARSLLLSIEKAESSRGKEVTNSEAFAMEGTSCSCADIDGESESFDGSSEIDISAHMLKDIETKLLRLDRLLSDIKSLNHFGHASKRECSPVKDMSFRKPKRKLNSPIVNIKESCSDSFEDMRSSREVGFGMQQVDRSARTARCSSEGGKFDDACMRCNGEELKRKMEADCVDFDEDTRSNDVHIDVLPSNDVQADKLGYGLNKTHKMIDNRAAAGRLRDVIDLTREDGQEQIYIVDDSSNSTVPEKDEEKLRNEVVCDVINLIESNCSGGCCFEDSCDRSDTSGRSSSRFDSLQDISAFNDLSDDSSPGSEDQCAVLDERNSYLSFCMNSDSTLSFHLDHSASSSV